MGFPRKMVSLIMPAKMSRGQGSTNGPGAAFEAVKLCCIDCNCLITAKQMYRHIIRNHLRYPAAGEIPQAFRPSPYEVQQLNDWLRRVTWDQDSRRRL